ncbi:Calmodulin [Amphibalanus amphitrite]|uniref:Calmodulin n=2 Tax=Amphibalanus amphitrite TaxID=1232801 RepID=A0A6A4X892_AMPAM|nr:Calmodulin [Amphibalanus amphitrite]
MEEERLSAFERDQALRKTFQIFDRKNMGMIGPNEIWAVLKNMGKDFSLDEIEEMVDEVDEDGKNRITYSEFVQLVMGEN